jgi:hypothetical protein
LTTQDLHLKKRATLSRNDERTGDVGSFITVTFTAGQSISSVINLGGETIVGIIFPPVWSIASATFQVSVDGTNWHDLYDESGEVTVSSASSTRAVSLDPVKTFPYPYVKLRSGTSGTPVNQVSNRTLTIVAKGV